MTDAELLNLAFTNLEVGAGSGFEDEVTALITQAKSDISKACDAEFDPDDPSECNAVVLFCRAMFGAGDDRAWTRYKERLQSLGVRKANA